MLLKSKTSAVLTLSPHGQNNKTTALREFCTAVLEGVYLKIKIA